MQGGHGVERPVKELDVLRLADDVFDQDISPVSDSPGCGSGLKWTLSGVIVIVLFERRQSGVGTLGIFELGLEALIDRG